MRILAAVALLAALACSRADQPRPGLESDTPGSLVGTSWQLVKFEGGDGTILTPDEPAKYRMHFVSDTFVGVRIDCNRGSGSWRATPPSSIEFGPMAVTRAMCPPGSMHDQILRQLPYVRSYIIKDGHLFLSLMADGGIYEFEKAPAEET